MISQDHVIKGSCDYVERSCSLLVTTLLRFVTIGMVVFNFFLKDYFILPVRAPHSKSSPCQVWWPQALRAWNYVFIGYKTRFHILTYYLTPITLVIIIFSVAYGIQVPNFVRTRSGRNKIKISWIKLKYDLMLSSAKLLYWYRK